MDCQKMKKPLKLNPLRETIKSNQLAPNFERMSNPRETFSEIVKKKLKTDNNSPT